MNILEYGCYRKKNRWKGAKMTGGEISQQKVRFKP